MNALLTRFFIRTKIRFVLVFFSLSTVLLLTTLVSCQDDDVAPPQGDYIPAEYMTTQKAIWLAYPPIDYKQGWSMLAVQANMIKELMTSVDIYYAINLPTEAEELRTALTRLGVTSQSIEERITFFPVEHGDLWVRDVGGIFMKSSDGGTYAVDFDFDDYRMAPYVTDETHAIFQFDNDLSHRTSGALGMEHTSSSLVAEGGNFHFNGKGTVIAVEASLRESNPGWTRSEIIAEIKRVFNVKKVILLPRGLPTDSHPVEEGPVYINGVPEFNLGVTHVDELVTWKDDRTIFLPEVTEGDLAENDPRTIVAKAVLDEAFEILSNETDQSGNRLQIIRVPELGPVVVDLLPGDGMYETLANLNGIRDFPYGSTARFALAASYMNYVITNDVILIPKFYKPGRAQSLQIKDQSFLNIIQQNFPDRRVVQIDVDAITVGGGGMHCITQQVPQ